MGLRIVFSRAVGDGNLYIVRCLGNHEKIQYGRRGGADDDTAFGDVCFMITGCLAEVPLGRCCVIIGVGYFTG